jgi:uncharacterized protein YodC (DUF2158 family)
MSQTSTFKVGSIVKLKSGGPDMTVNVVLMNHITDRPNGNYKCQWFAGKKLEDGIFPGDSLNIVTQEISS